MRQRPLTERSSRQQPATPTLSSRADLVTAPGTVPAADLLTNPSRWSKARQKDSPRQGYTAGRRIYPAGRALSTDAGCFRLDLRPGALSAGVFGRAQIGCHRRSGVYPAISARDLAAKNQIADAENQTASDQLLATLRIEMVTRRQGLRVARLRAGAALIR